MKKQKYVQVYQLPNKSPAISLTETDEHDLVLSREWRFRDLANAVIHAETIQHGGKGAERTIEDLSRVPFAYVSIERHRPTETSRGYTDYIGEKETLRVSMWASDDVSTATIPSTVTPPHHKFILERSKLGTVLRLGNGAITITDPKPMPLMALQELDVLSVCVANSKVRGFKQVTVTTIPGSKRTYTCKGQLPKIQLTPDSGMSIHAHHQ